MSLGRDGSVTLAWHYSDEVTEAIRRVFERSRSPTASPWPRGAGTSREFCVSLSDHAMLEITIDPHNNTKAWGQTLQLADECGLTVCDAAYLELAALFAPVLAPKRSEVLLDRGGRQNLLMPG